MPILKFISSSELASCERKFLTSELYISASASGIVFNCGGVGREIESRQVLVGSFYIIINVLGYFGSFLYNKNVS
jgi:hypothetical protein